MNKLIICIGFILLGFMIGAAFGQGEANRFELVSKAVQVQYKIEVVVPTGTFSAEAKYPVIYCTDWFILKDYLNALPKLMKLGQLTEPYIVVGITEGQNTDDWAVMRTRDFTPSYPTDEYSKKNMYSKALDKTGGAIKFTKFLKEELVPYIESKYQCDSTRRCFLGYSLGGLLGVHILTSNPQLFQYYLLGSPSLWFNNFYLASELGEMTAERLQTIKKVYLSVGEEESWEMMKGFCMLRDTFKEKGFEESKIKTEIIAASGHVGAMPIALYNGIRFLFRNN